MVLPSSAILGSRFPDHQPEPTNTVHPGTTHRGSAALNSDSLASFVSPNISTTLSPSRLAYRVNEQGPSIWEEAETAHSTTKKDCEVPKKSIYNKVKRSFKKYFGADTQEAPRLKPSISIAQRIFSCSSSSASPVSFHLATPPVVGLEMRQEQLSRTAMTRTSTREPSRHLVLPQTNSNRPQKLTENQHSQNVTLPEYGWPFGLATIKELRIVGQVPTTAMPSTNKTNRVTSRETPQRASTSTAVEPQQETNPKDQSVSLPRQKKHVRFSDPPLTGVRFIPAREERRIVSQVTTTAMPSTNEANRVTSRENPQTASGSDTWSGPEVNVGDSEIRPSPKGTTLEQAGQTIANNVPSSLLWHDLPTAHVIVWPSELASVYKGMIAEGPASVSKGTIAEGPAQKPNL